MTDYSYIHIIVRADIDGATRTVFKWNVADDDRTWEKTLVTPAAAVKRFLNASECYILQQSAEGHCFSLITPNPIRSAGGYEMISVMIDNECSLTGKQLSVLFSTLEKTLAADGNLTAETVTEAMKSAEIPAEPVRRTSWHYVAPTDGTPREEGAYRTFISSSELSTIFSFPSQPDYAPYRCIIVVPATSSLRPGVKMPRITTPIRKQYTIVAPADITVSAPTAYDGERLTITFTKPGFDPHTETFTVGSPSAYARIDGSTIRIRQPRECGIRFIRRVGLSVSSAKGTPLNGYTISVNGRSVSTIEPFIEFTEKDLCDSNKVEIKVASNNYTPVKLEKSVDEILSGEKLDIVLQPIEQGVTLRLDFGDGRVIEQFISIEKNTPEYNRLHSGNFHGFRAYRLVTQDHSEVYNVDVRFDGRPVAPNFETARSTEVEETSQTSYTAPVFENVANQTPDDKDPIDKTVPTVETETETEAIAEAETDERQGRTRIRWIMTAAAAIIALVVVFVFVLPRGEKLDVAPEAQVIADDAVADISGVAPAAPVADAPIPTPPTAPQAAGPEFGADVTYLNSNSVWSKSSLTTPQGRSLIDAIAAGDIEAVAQSDYFAVAGKCTNAKANQALNLMWRAKGSPTAKRVVAEMKKAAQNGTIDLNKLVDRLARYQPVDADANTAPRPTR